MTSQAKTIVMTVEAEEDDRVISRGEFLIGRVLSMRQGGLLPDAYRLDAKSIAISDIAEYPSSPIPDAPPGLEDMCSLARAEREHQLLPIPPPPPLPTEQYQVLLLNLPEKILSQCMLRVVLEQAGLSDVVDMCFPAKGEALITFGTYAMVPPCIRHFKGCQWNRLDSPIDALFIAPFAPNGDWAGGTASCLTAKNMSADATVFVPVSTPLSSHKFSTDGPCLTAKNMSAGATVFVPASTPFSSHKLSTDAPAFVPTAGLTTKRDGSEGSTSGPSSDGAMSDDCDSELCT